MTEVALDMVWIYGLSEHRRMAAVAVGVLQLIIAISVALGACHG
jgi:hypothetical protein